MSKSYGNSILLSDEATQVEEKIKNSVTDRPKLSDRGSPDRCPVGNLHQIFSDRERLEYITRGCTQATITCVECKVLATQSTDAHLGPIRERRREKAQNPGLLTEIIEQGTAKATKVAEETMVAVREAIGLLNLDSVAGLMRKQSDALRLRVPESIAAAKDDEERWTIRTDIWLDRISKTYPLKKDRPRTFITLRGRKVGVHTAKEDDGIWTFHFQDRPLNVLVLLAQDDDLYLHDYVLPPKIVQEHWKQFDREGKKVTVVVRKSPDSNVLLHLGGGVSPISIGKYEGDYSALQ
jgi:hypothetical protein